MIKHNQNGASGVGVSLVIAVVLLIGAIVFGAWAYTGKLDYKTHTDDKIAVAVAAAKEQEGDVKAKEYAELAKQPLTTYKGPEAYGSVVINYPKNWSGYVDDTGTAPDNALVDGYLYPGVVPSITGNKSVFAVRFQVVNRTYADVLASFTDAQAAGAVTVKPYSLPKLPANSGAQISGKLSDQKTGTMIIVPLRAQTIKVWTEGSQFTNDFNSYILPNFSFSP